MDEEMLVHDADEQREHVPYSVGRQYVMDWRGSFPKAEELSAEPVTEAAAEAVQEDAPEAVPDTEPVHSPKTVSVSDRSAVQDVNIRLAACIVITVVGIVAGLLSAMLSPPDGADIAACSAVADGSFGELLSGRLAVCGAFLAAEYIIGYFAFGSYLVWLMPLIYGMSVGVTAAGVFAAGAYHWVILPCIICAAVNASAAAASWEFSSVILDIVSGRGDVISDGRLAGRYSLRFGGCALITCIAAFAEAAAKAYL